MFTIFPGEPSSCGDTENFVPARKCRRRDSSVVPIASESGAVGGLSDALDGDHPVLPMDLLQLAEPINFLESNEPMDILEPSVLLDVLEPIRNETVASVSNTVNSDRRVLPVPRKPDCILPPYQGSESDESEDSIPNQPHTGGGSKSEIMENLVGRFSVSEVKPDGKRPMFIPITQSQLDAYGLSFLKSEPLLLHTVIRGLPHALRFWLTVKFYNFPKGSIGLSKSGLCKLFGIDSNSFFKYLPKIQGKTFADFDGFSPFEYLNLRSCIHPRVIRNLASNYDSVLVQSIVKKNYTGK